VASKCFHPWCLCSQNATLARTQGCKQEKKLGKYYNKNKKDITKIKTKINVF
jgi:hypothetical protein